MVCPPNTSTINTKTKSTTAVVALPPIAARTKNTKPITTKNGIKNPDHALAPTTKTTSINSATNQAKISVETLKSHMIIKGLITIAEETPKRIEEIAMMTTKVCLDSATYAMMTEKETISNIEKTIGDKKT